MKFVQLNNFIFYIYIYIYIYIYVYIYIYQFILIYTISSLLRFLKVMRAVVPFCNNIFFPFLKQENFSIIISKILYKGYKRHCAILLFLIFDILDTQIKSFPRKKSVATTFVSFHHSS